MGAMLKNRMSGEGEMKGYAIFLRVIFGNCSCIALPTHIPVGVTRKNPSP